MSVLSKHINILVMPTDSCNMNCIYCFHSPYHKSKGHMSYTLLQKLYDITFRDYKSVTFIWHGGEPLLMGVEFYRKAIEMQRKYYGMKIKNRMQSNLTLLNEDIVKFFKNNGVTVGSSFDGCKNE